MENVIAYALRNNLYLNPTNRCTARCTFCHRVANPTIKDHNLRLQMEPSVQELVQEIGDPTRFQEVVFCGYGEPTLRLEVITDVAKVIKSRGGRVRLNTNGHGNLIHKRNILPDMKGIIDHISVSLNAENPLKYLNLCKPVFGPYTYAAVISFIKEAKRHIPNVSLSVVNLPSIDQSACERIAKEKLGVAFQVRELDVIG